MAEKSLRIEKMERTDVAWREGQNGEELNQGQEIPGHVPVISARKTTDGYTSGDSVYFATLHTMSHSSWVASIE